MVVASRGVGQLRRVDWEGLSVFIQLVTAVSCFGGGKRHLTTFLERHSRYGQNRTYQSICEINVAPPDNYEYLEYSPRKRKSILPGLHNELVLLCAPVHPRRLILLVNRIDRVGT